jgi:hypothetical protein
MTRPSTALTVVHEPHGLDGRYDARFEERRPRDPVGGDMVSIGFLTRPGGLAIDIRLHWCRNSRPQTTVLARPVARGTDEDRWLVELGIVEAGDAVEYWISATGAGETAVSPRFGFVTRRWRRLAGIAATEQTDEGVWLAMLGEGGLVGPRLDLNGKGVVRLSIGPHPLPALSPPPGGSRFPRETVGG